MNVPAVNLPRIVVIGCGFAGLKFTKRIDSSRFQVVLIDKNNYHTFQPLLYQVASSGLAPDSIVYPIRKIFKGKSNFFFRMAKVEHISTAEKMVHTDIGRIKYDHLVIASGATNNFFGMEQIEKYSMPMKSLTESLDLRSLILQNFEEALNTNDLEERNRLMNFVIVGGGPTGVELAGAISELREHVLPNDYPDLDFRQMQIHIIEAGSRVLGAMSEHASQKASKALDKFGVQVWLDTRVEDYDGDTVQTSKSNFESKTMIWAAGIQGSIPGGLNAAVGRGRRILVDSFNQIEGMDQVYSIGDVAQINSEDYPNGNPMLASVAEQQGAHLARNLNRSLGGRPLQPFVYKDKGTMATIGRNKAVVDLPFWKFSGFFGWLTWMFVHLMLLVDFRSRLVVFVDWVYSYIRYDKGTRLIVRKAGTFKKQDRS
ncbi:MAG: NAD(P)/FAD-dependent oxidoreductase [Saprospiraceae bacterium]|nr:NAD(P)/FAD-dependent oxidoreductase [Saprospiraceae bacterium]